MIERKGIIKVMEVYRGFAREVVRILHAILSELINAHLVC